MPALRTRLAAAAVVPFLALGLTACFGGGPNTDPGTGSGTETEEGSSGAGSAPPTSFTTAPWATTVDPQGEWLTSVSNDDLRIDIYQVGIEDAPDDSAWSYNDTEEPLFEAGDPIVILQYVFTNTGKEDIVLPSGSTGTTARYANINLASIPPESRFGELVASLGVPEDGAIDFTYSNENNYDGLTGNWDMPVAPGESASWHEVYVYEADDTFSLEFTVQPYVDGEFVYSDDLYNSGEVKIPIG